MHPDDPQHLTQAGGLPWYTWLPGTVVSDQDPDKRGRVQVRVPHVYGAEDEDEYILDPDLPWALPMQNVYEQTGEMWVPPVGSVVWVSFIAGSHEDPIYTGGYAIPNDAIAEHVSSYAPGPQSRVIKTINGHLFEMRWLPGEEQIKLLTALGVQLQLIDADALGGPKLIGQTPEGYQVDIDQKLGRITLTTPSGYTLLLDQTGTLARLTTPAASLTLNGVSGLAALAATNITLTAVAAVALTAVALTLTASGLMSITGSGLALLTTAGAVTIGAAGTFQALATAYFVNTTFMGHTHAVTSAPGTSGPPSSVIVADDLTSNTTAN